MQYRALACDYDGTIATNGRVDEATLASLQRFARSGRQLLLVTGRELPDLKSTFPELAIFHYVVAENGGLLYVPSTEQEHPLAEGPPARFVQELIARGVGPISVGRSMLCDASIGWVSPGKLVIGEPQSTPWSLSGISSDVRSSTT